jgi:tRNA(Ile)-lysidine synthase
MTAPLLGCLAERISEIEAVHGAPGGFVVALSGGVDSVTLLAAMCRLGHAHRLRCIHVDHQLHRQSAQWARFCEDIAAEAGVPLRSCRVDCESVSGASPEAAARDARYAAFAAELRHAELLLTAHHANDQLETLLFRMMRGTGVDGLRGIRTLSRFGPGFLLRPWLDVGREAILAQASEWGLRWLEDPANTDARFDRNYLRHRALPDLLERWPAAPSAAARLAAAAQDAGEIAAALASQDLGGLESLDRLPLALLGSLSQARQRNALRYAIRVLELPMPDSAALARVLHLVSDGDASACIGWPGAQARRWSDALYLCGEPAPLPPLVQPLQPGTACRVGEGRLELEAAAAAAPGLPDAWVRRGLTVRFRSGGERFRPAGSSRAFDLREWMRASRLLPWMRDRIPLLYYGEELVAVADIGLGAAAAEAGERGWRIAWRERPRIF